MTKDTKEIVKLVLCIVAAVSLAVVIYAMWGKTADSKKIKSTDTFTEFMSEMKKEHQKTARPVSMAPYEVNDEKRFDIQMSNYKWVSTPYEEFEIKELIGYEFLHNPSGPDNVVVLYTENGCTNIDLKTVKFHN